MLLRGPQTAAELRARTERMQPVFADVAAVETAPQGLAEHTQGPLTVKLVRESGRREARWAHLLSGPPTAATSPTAGSDAVAPPVTASAVSRLDRLELELAAVREHVAGLEARFDQRRDGGRRRGRSCG